MARWDLLLTDARIATMRRDDAGFGIIDDGALAIRDGAIAWIGAARDNPGESATETRTLDGHWITPALVDCHTHLVFGGDRAAEFEQRLAGASYEDIARAGGGILSTVAATRAASIDELLASALPRLDALIASGVATVEIKSGYGLDVDSELKMLDVARRLGQERDVTVVTTLLAAHAVPPEFGDDADGWIDQVCNELIPAAAERRIADAVDAYCETIAFDTAQVGRVFDAAREYGLPVKLHADQLSDGSGAALAAGYSALSADHLEYSSQDGIAAMAAAGTAAVLLPGAFLTLSETQQPPVAALREHGVPIAVATDCNPGTSPLTSMQEAMALASRLFRLTPEECLAGATREAALALGLEDRGTIATGMRADLAVWDIDHPRDLAYWLGRDALAHLFIEGRSVSLTGA
ncbi:MAG: imidazolonepropionase [Woeseiaceae bacterium]|nr:imidazolonepropionase [Woeseiaceae bacterium]